MRSSGLTRLPRRWPTVAAAAVPVAAVVGGLSLLQPTEYTATSQQYVGFNGADSPNQLQQGSAYTQSQMASFGLLATSPTVLQPVIERENLSMSVEDLTEKVQVTTPRNTVVLQIEVTADDPERAAEITNAIADQLESTLDRIGPRRANDQAQLSISQIAKAVPPPDPSAPKTVRNVVLGALMGLILGLGLAELVGRRSGRVTAAAVSADPAGAPVLGAVRRPADVGKVVSALEMLPAAASPSVIMLSSPTRSVGQSTLAVELGSQLVANRRRVALVDLQLRDPELADLVGVAGHRGWTDAISGASLVDLTRSIRDRGFDLIPAGMLADESNAAEFLGPRYLDPLLAQLRSRYDHVILSVGPVLSLADPMIVGTHADVVLLVADARDTRRTDLTRAVQHLGLGGIETAGVVIVSAPRSTADPMPSHRLSTASR